MKFYRYEDQLINWDYNIGNPIVHIHLTTFELIRETPKGYWIKDSFWSDDHRWVSKTAKKRYAYPTKEEAMENFRARKERQITILTKQLARAKEALEISQNEVY